MIFYGWGKKSIPLGDIEQQSCPRCGGFRPFRALLTYSYFHLYWIFGVVTGKKYLAACAACGSGIQLDPTRVSHLTGDKSIPFMQRWGLAILGGIIVLIAIYFAIEK